ncbi:MAG: GGDEF domain-containing protein [Lachnospiraceae bacterium]|jgi:diguanylate cyclase (GGDEF)-like protein|nr:GGDEF domain-containing protein [Lachnospiraceae bacterium]
MNERGRELEKLYKENKNNIPLMKKELARYLKEGKATNNLFLIGAVNYYEAMLSYRKGLRVNMLTQALKAVSIFDETEDYDMIALCNNILGVAYVAQENYQMALASYEKVLRIVRANKKSRISKISVNNNIADCYYQMGDYKKSLKLVVQCFNKTIKKNPDAHEGIVIYGINLADCYESTDNLDKAWETLLLTEEHLEGADNIMLVSVYYARRACVAYHAGKVEEGNRCMDKVFELANSGVDTYEMHRDLEKIAKQLPQIGELDRMKKIMQILDDYARKSNHVLDKIIACRVRSEYQRAMKLDPDAFATYMELFRLYEQRKEEEKSVQLLVQKKTEATNKEIKRLVERVHQREAEAITDRLTGLYNKRGAEEKIPLLCGKSGGMVIVLDLDNFKLVNDLYGHETGDKVLSGFAEILRSKCRPGDIPCRIGGDEFLVYLKTAMDERGASILAENLNVQVLELCRKLTSEDFKIPMGVSVGGVRIPEQGEKYERLFAFADKALYQVKQNGKHSYKLYDTDLYGEKVKPEDLEKELNHMLTICGERGDVRSAMWVGQEAFSWIYRFVERFCNRHNCSVTKVLLSVTYTGKKEAEEYMEAVYQFGCTLQNVLRKNDVILQCCSNCFLLLVPEMEEEHMESVLTRIKEAWKDSEYHDVVRIGYSEKASVYGFDKEKKKAYSRETSGGGIL